MSPFAWASRERLPGGISSLSDRRSRTPGRVAVQGSVCPVHTGLREPQSRRAIGEEGCVSHASLRHQCGLVLKTQRHVKATARNYLRSQRDIHISKISSGLKGV